MNKFGINNFIYLKKQISNLNDVNFKLDSEGSQRFGTLQNFKDFVDEFFTYRLKKKANFRKKLLKEIENENYVKNKIQTIANKFFIRKATLREFYDLEVLASTRDNIDIDDYTSHNIDFFENNVDKKKFNFIKSDLIKTLQKQYIFIHTKGFPENTMYINKGVMTANAGDSAEFLFISRAILIGFNCSNVDVRSSRYDAIIDFEGKLLRIQVKGLSGSTISLKDRDRGGQGIDYRNESNRGKRVSSEECDIYIAVDRRFGTCYIIPVRDYIDAILDKDIGKPINIKNIDHYRENWSIIEKVAKSI